MFIGQPGTMNLTLSNAFMEFLDTRRSSTDVNVITFEDINTKETFDSIILHLRSSDYIETISEEELTVKGETTVLRVTGLPEISRYCYSESPNTVSNKQYERHIVVLDSVMPNEFAVKMRYTVEKQESAPEPDLDIWPTLPKTYSIEKTFVYKSKYEYRLKLVKSTDEATQTMIQSGVSQARPVYQVQYIIGENDTTHDIINACVYMVQLITGQRFPISNTQQTNVLDNYDKLVRTVLTSNRRHTEGSKYHFLAPKPITLETFNIVQPGPHTYGVNSVWQDYAVTDKADGERILLYIDNDGCAYFINNTFDVSFSGLKTTDKTLSNSLLDGEFIRAMQRRDGSQKDIFAAFDIYFYNGKSVMNLPLLGSSCRNALMQEACAKGKWSSQSNTEMIYKEHIPADGDKMRKACDSILKNVAKLPYDIDGLVFTPRDLSVYAYYPGRPVEITERVRWDKVLKWKPPHQNTIDFKVVIANKTTVGNKRYAHIRLYTGYNAGHTEPISPLYGIQLRYDPRAYKQWKSMGDVYRSELFRPISHYASGVDTALIELSPNGDILCEDNSIIENNSIVEFGYNDNSTIEVGRRWVPLRVRVDKTRILQKTGNISKTANDFSVATSIWRSIHDPVTAAMLINGNVPASKVPDSLEERMLGTDDIYYARDIPRHHMLSVNMLNFHNIGIKKMLYQRSKRRDSLLELACGMAGDMPRWRDAGYRFVLGVDLARDNITKPRDGAYGRMLNQSRAVKTLVNGVEETIYPDIVFAIGDCAIPIHTGAAAEKLDEESVHILNMLYKGSGKVEPWMKHVVGRAGKGFSVVSCQFAIHYFFKTEDTLNGFLENVAFNLKKGGIFVTTFMDGQSVKNLLSTSSSGIVEGRKLDGKIPVWAILKRYQDNDDPYGKHVDIFLENTNRLIPEFLVDLDTLVDKARVYGLELDDTALFSDNFAKLHAAVPKDTKRRSKLDEAVLALKKDTVQTQFSFLNRWVVFKKI